MNTPILSILIFATLVCSQASFAKEVDSLQLQIDEIEQSLKFETGTVELESGNATINVPEGFGYLDKEQSIYVLSDLWGNPLDTSILGMLVPKDRGVLADNGWAFTISFDEIGYIKDDDAADINYDDLLKEGQKETSEANAERIEQGFLPIEFIGWASHPYYDKDKKVLHWAKELKFGTDSLNTLNYNLRILGRKGIFVVNAVASMRELPEVKASIDGIINNIQLKDGHRYTDYVANVDKVAAWTIGGLVAGKVLAKAGFFALILKFWKIIAVAVSSLFYGIWNKIKKNNDGE
jgi:uncharacterized membrane-anchored protein